MDIFVLKALIDGLQATLLGAVITKVFQMTADDILLRLWRRQDMRLFLSIRPPEPHLLLTTERFHNPQQPPRFAALLRARLAGMRLQALRVTPYERVVSLHWERPDDPAAALTLIHELAGARANLVLVNASGVIVDACKHIPSATAQRAPVLPGLPYQPPVLPPQRRLLSTVTAADLQQLHAQGAWDTAHLQRLLVGFSGPLIAELLHRSQGDPLACWEIVHTLREDYAQGRLMLSVCTTPDGRRQVSALPLTHCAYTIEPWASAPDAVAACYQPLLHTTAVTHTRSLLHKTVRQRLQKLRQKVTHLTQDAATLESYLPYQHYGTLLVAQRLPRGATHATVVDYYSPEQATLTITLDPRLSIQDNAQSYFKKYRKAKNGLTKVQTLLTQCIAEERYLDSLAQRLDEAEDIETLTAIAAELGPAAASSQTRGTLAIRAATPAALSYRTFVSREGYTLYCGKSHQGNEELLRRVATPEDIWLHAHQQAGAHVVLKVSPHQDPPWSALQEAAALAAFFSKGKDAASVEVIYTAVKHVRKFRGARPGQVHVQTYRTLEVAPQLPTTDELHRTDVPLLAGTAQRGNEDKVL